MKQNLNCSGSTRIDGGEYGEVRVSASLRVDGENVAGNLIPMKDGKKKYYVEVTV